MHKPKVPVTFLPLDTTVEVQSGTRLIEAAAAAGVSLDLPCGGDGTCGKCRVLVRSGAAEPNAAEQDALGDRELDQGYRLACQSLAGGPTIVEVPETSLLGSSHKILADTKHQAPADVDPEISLRYVELPPPDRGDDEPDLVRLERVLGPFEVDFGLMRELPGRLRDAGFRGTAVMADRELIDFDSGNTSVAFAVAIDLGTTTLVAKLLNLTTGREAAITSRLNPQTRWGDDVLSRIQHARDNQQGLAELHGAIVEACNQMIGELADRAGIDRERIFELTFSGNTTMLHLLCLIDPRWLGEVPFVPATGHRLLGPASKLGIKVHPRGRAYVLPVIGGFVGGDTVAGILATDLAGAKGPSLLLDIGTNGEIVLFSEGKLEAAATAAGPAFEGAGISHGMRGRQGAIERVAIDGTVSLNVIGNVPPLGLCGSALIDLVAGLLRHRILTPDGRMCLADQLPGDLSEELRRRVVPHDGQQAFMVAGEEESGTGKPIVLTQRDVRQLQLASGAIRAGVTILLKRAAVEPDELQNVFIGGGFGNFIRRGNAQRMGLLPVGIPPDRIRYRGNTSLAGAELVAVSRRARKLAEELARRAEHVDLSSDPDFHHVFAESMIFPE